ncbi:GL14176 [Drosophila persimilis]|uniref:GL14176 n=1 Tax=Drosophila persimilis TaxID=7234 RepID=B4GTZ7_DROPE|nr:GL14176 [Drosophila persimilis]
MARNRMCKNFGACAYDTAANARAHDADVALLVLRLCRRRRRQDTTDTRPGPKPKHGMKQLQSKARQRTAGSELLRALVIVFVPESLAAGGISITTLEEDRDETFTSAWIFYFLSLNTPYHEAIDDDDDDDNSCLRRWLLMLLVL